MAEQTRPGFWKRFFTALVRLFVRSADKAVSGTPDGAEHERRMREMQAEHRQRMERGTRQSDGRLG